MQTLTRWIVRATLPLTLILAACDSEPVDERGADVEQASVQDDQARGHHGPPWEKICALAECSDAQVDQVAALFKANRPDHKRGERPEPGAFKDQNLALAAKVRDGSLSAADLEAHRQAIHAGMPEMGPKGPMGALLVGLHKIMTPAQRGVLADAFLAGKGGGFLRFGGPHERGDRGERGERGERGPRGDHDGESHGKDGHGGKLKGLGKICKIAECSDAQRATLTEMASKAREAGKAGREQAKATMEAAGKALADAFRGDAFDQGAVDRFHATIQPLHAGKAQAMDQLVIDGLAIFDDAQRAKLATAVEEKGMRALISGKGKHGKHGKRGRKGKRGGHDSSESVPT